MGSAGPSHLPARMVRRPLRRHHHPDRTSRSAAELVRNHSALRSQPPLRPQGATLQAATHQGARGVPQVGSAGPSHRRPRAGLPRRLVPRRQRASRHWRPSSLADRSQWAPQSHRLNRWVPFRRRNWSRPVNRCQAEGLDPELAPPLPPRHSNSLR